MPSLTVGTPLCSVRLYKTISRTTVDGQSAVSARYEGKDDSIDLTPFLDDQSSVRTSKSIREPSGGFVLTFADKASKNSQYGGELESVYALVEPMDMVEIRMWGGSGVPPAVMPIVMRGFVSSVDLQPGMGDDGRPIQVVTVSGQDFGKIWQTFQVIYLAAYAEREALLTNFGLWELFGIEAENALPAADFVRTMIDQVINPHLDGFVPKNFPIRQIQTGDSISVAHGVVNNSYQQMQGSIFDILKLHGDVGPWNELYTEDREDGVHCVYRAIPALSISEQGGAGGRKIQDDAPDPTFVTILDDVIQSMPMKRSDSNVANFFWVNNSRFDLIDELQRKLASIPADDDRVSTKDYANTAVKYYGVRPMYSQTQQGGDEIATMTSGQDEGVQTERGEQQEAWIDKRRRLLIEMNRDNVVLESGSARVKGGPMRDADDLMRPGDYAVFKRGRMPDTEAYVVQIDHEFMPFRSYTSVLHCERGTGFVTRAQMGGGAASPWLAERARRKGGAF